MSYCRTLHRLQHHDMRIMSDGLHAYMRKIQYTLSLSLSLSIILSYYLSLSICLSPYVPKHLPVCPSSSLSKVPHLIMDLLLTCGKGKRRRRKRSRRRRRWRRRGKRRRRSRTEGRRKGSQISNSTNFAENNKQTKQS